VFYFYLRLSWKLALVKYVSEKKVFWGMDSFFASKEIQEVQ
jgi:hypothetical protein